MSTFVAIDFETATGRRDSACAVGLVACSGGRIVLSRSYLIRPPSARFTFTGVHGLVWDDVRNAPTFAELWPVLRPWLDGVRFLAAHNAPFDRSVLRACCARYRLRPPRTPFICTVALARKQWGIRPTKLPDVCRRLGIPLLHHDAASDSAACARIVLAAEANGWQRGTGRGRRTTSRALVCTGTTRGPAVACGHVLRSRWRQLRSGIADQQTTGVITSPARRGRGEMSPERTDWVHRASVPAPCR